jgi:hypothetical protein
MNAPAPPPITVLNLRRYERNTLRAFADLQLASGLILRGCTLHESHGKQWVGTRHVARRFRTPRRLKAVRPARVESPCGAGPACNATI